MKRKTIYGVCVTLCVVLSLSFKPGSAKVEWSATKRLVWSDFKGKPAKNSSGIASTYSYIELIKENETSSGATYYIAALFVPAKSWVVYKDKVVLSHENGHFDITELYSRKFKQEIAKTKFSKSNYKAELDAMYERFDNAADTYHDKYDDETESSMDLEKQKQWEKKILDDIKDLDAYAVTSVQILFK